MRNRDRVIIFLASKASKCATMEEIMDMLLKAGTLNAKDKKHQVEKLLSKMAIKGDIKRSWISWAGRKKRIYCLRWGD